jgi:hypothetical protein
MASARWFPEKIAAAETATSGPGTKSESSFEAVVRAFSQPQVPDELWHAVSEIASQTVHRLRSFLHQRKLKAYYFASDGRHLVPPEFWATADADDVMEFGIYWPFGRPHAWHQQLPNYSLFLGRSELNTLLSNQQPKRPFPLARTSELADALRKLDHLSRPEQLKELCARFPNFKITDKLFRQVARETGPRDPGRKSRR